jgi:hypothetical protein
MYYLRRYLRKQPFQEQYLYFKYKSNMYQAVQLLVMIVVLFIYFKVVEATWLTCI